MSRWVCRIAGVADDGLEIEYAAELGDLEAALAGVERPGEYFASGSMETVMPTLRVAGVGTISFPVPAAQARELIERAAERAPYGRGDRTVVDESVRKVWQIAATKVEIGGRGWGVTLDNLVERIGVELGCGEGPVATEFYKLLVYEEGGFFAAHRDSEKAGGMFGTLVVTLPSEHAGGELVVRHAGRERVLDLCAEGAGEIRYAAFYADCEHEVRPIRSGFRVGLVFNLIRRGGKLAPPDERPAVRAAAECLREWATGGGAPRKLVYLLDHHYTQAALAMVGLKNRDAAVAKVLGAAAVAADCAMHLGIVHVEESGWAEHDGGGYYGRRSSRRWSDDDEDDDDDEDQSGFEIGEVCDGRRYLNQWRDAKDRPVEFGEIPLEDGEVLPVGALDGVAADETHFSEATGNEGASFERTYLRAALVIWPEDCFDAICLSAGIDAGVTRLEQMAGADGSETGARKLALLIRDRWTDDHRNGARLNRLLDALVRLGDVELLAEVAGDLVEESYSGSQNPALVRMARMLGADRAKPIFEALVARWTKRYPGACLDLWVGIADVGGDERGWVALLDALLDALIGELPSASNREAWTPGAWTPASLRRYCVSLESRRAESDGAGGGEMRVSAEGVVVFLGAVENSRGADRLGGAVRAVLANGAVFPVETILLSALELIEEAEAEISAAVRGMIWEHCAGHYLLRSERPPAEPTDWAQSVSVAGDSALLRDLETFARDPEAQVHRFRLRKDLRQVIHREIDRLGLDMTHVTERKGSPHALVCTKTRATYERACGRYEADRVEMGRLLALALAGEEGREAMVERLRVAAG